ncbi:MAG: universal stress protein [Fibrobacterota bacterium]
MFSKVIIATDLSAASMEVVRCACGLASLGTKEILLLHCISSMEAASAGFAEDNQRIENMLEEQKSILLGQDFKVEAQTVLGTPHREINRIAAQNNYSLVMVGSHGRTLSKDIFLGSVASEIIQKTSMPLLVVRLEIISDPENSTGLIPRVCSTFGSSVLFPTDFSENADHAFTYLKKLVERETSSVTLVHVQDIIKDQIERYDQLSELANDRLDNLEQALLRVKEDIDISKIVVDGNPSQEILKISRATNPSMIVMGSQGKGYVKELFMGSVSHEVTRKANTSVLFVPSSTRGDQQ